MRTQVIKRHSYTGQRNVVTYSRMKKYILPLLLMCLSALSLADSASNDVTATVNDATALATQMRTSTPVIQNGSIVTSSTGAVQTTTSSSSSTAATAAYVQGMTGLTGTVQTANPAAGDTAGAQASATYTADFSCSTGANSTLSIGGYSAKLEGCTVAAKSITAVTLQLCGATLQGGSCAAASAFSAPVQVQANAYATVGTTQLGLGCTDATATCRLTLVSNYSVTTTGAALDTTDRQTASAQNSDTNTAQGTIVAMRTQTDSSGNNVYNQESASVGQSTATCAQNAAAATAAGQNATTCDGTQTVDTTSLTSANATATDCSTASTCVRTATQQTSFTRSCTRTFPTTSRVCSYTTQTATCDITWVDQLDPTTNLPTGTKVESSSCSSTDISGGTKFNSQNSTVCGWTNADGSCQQYNRTDYYSWPAVQSGACHGDPYIASSTCVTTAGQVDTQYSSDPTTWVGRTNTWAQCTSVDPTDPNSVAIQVDNSVIPGCGVSTSFQTGATCYAQLPLTRDPASETAAEIAAGGAAAESDDTCTTTDLTGCTQTTPTNVVASDSGLVTSQTENYNCVSSTETCVQYAPAPGCTAVNAANNYGMTPATYETAGQNNSAMNTALATQAVGTSMADSMADNSSENAVLTIFDGTSQHCQQPTGSWGSNGYYMDCCKISLTRPGGSFGKLNSCTETDAALAAARRANYTVYLGDYCSKKLPWPLSKCIMRTQGYCQFPGVLPRIIQEQGRAQLAAIAASGVGAQLQQGTLAYSFYGTNGSWTAPVTVNGIQVAAWQYPSYCKDPVLAAQTLAANPTFQACPPQLQQSFATCDSPDGCDALPDFPDEGSPKWLLTVADPLQNVTTAVSRFAVVKGSCDPTSSACSYQISAWPSGQGGKAVVSRQFSYTVYVTAAAGTTPGPVEGTVSSVGDFYLKPVSISVANGAIPTTLPTTVTLEFSSDGGKTFQNYSVPTADTADFALGASGATLSGNCSATTDVCQWTLTATATVTAMPWGTPQTPLCEGFSPGQLSELDFSKMDFSEWISSVASSTTGSTSSALVSAATTTAQSYDSTYSAGGSVTVTATASQGAEVARVVPSEGFGPFQVTLKVAGYWPFTTGDPTQDTNQVTGVTVDWGDCTTTDTLNFISQVNGQAARGFSGIHTYTRPQDVPAACGGGPTNLTHTLKLLVSTSQSGTQAVNLSVNNAYDTMGGQGTNSATVTSTTSTTLAPQGSTTSGN